MGKTMSKNWPLLQDKIGYTFNDTTFLEEATTHDSMRVNNPNLRHYERLEHVGDTVIQMVITEYLFLSNPNDDEGILTHKRKQLVCKQKQSEIASELKLHEFISVAQGMQVDKFTRYDKFLEAIVGAVYMDAGGSKGQGLNAAKRVVLKLWKLKEPEVPASCQIC